MICLSTSILVSHRSVNHSGVKLVITNNARMSVLTIHETFHQRNWKGWTMWSNNQPSAGAPPQIDGADISVSSSGKANYDSRHNLWWNWRESAPGCERAIIMTGTSVGGEIEELTSLLTTSSSRVNSLARRASKCSAAGLLTHFLWIHNWGTLMWLFSTTYWSAGSKNMGSAVCLNHNTHELFPSLPEERC